MEKNENYVITTDNGSDLGSKMLSKLGIEEIRLPVIVDGEEYDGVSRTIESAEIYNLMRAGSKVTTSQINPTQAERFFEGYLKEGKDIIHISLGSNVSGTYSSCMMAKMMLKERYPDNRIEIIDTRGGSMGEGWLVIDACRQRDAGKSIDEMIAHIEEKKKSVRYLFVLEDLKYMQQSGRISKSKEIIGTIVGIKPILTLNQEGKIVEMAKYIGKNRTVSAMIDKLEETIDIKNTPFITISHGDSMEEADRIAKIIKKRIGVKEIIIEELGPMIGVHGGPGTIAIFYVGADPIGRKQDVRRRELYEKFRNNHR